MLGKKVPPDNVLRAVAKVGWVGTSRVLPTSAMGLMRAVKANSVPEDWEELVLPLLQIDNT
jgi:hypothetical protein